MLLTVLGSGAIGMVQPVAAQPVVQALPDPAASTLSEALLALSRNPESLEALLTAGRSSLTLGQIESAEGFFRRAEAVAPGDGRVKAGLAGLALRRQQPADAARLFAEAESAGVEMRPYAAEQGLAYDLLGDNANAQRVYQRALAAGEDAELSRRLAVSQAIAGDKSASEGTLLPLLQNSDLAAFRTRAFALAILGEEEEAVSIAQTMLPEGVSSRLAPYLRYMPRLTRAQQAAAANLGIFPPAGEIGRDRPAVAAYATQAPPSAAAPPVAATRPVNSDERLAPQGPALGRSVAQAPARQPAAAQASAAPEAPVTAEPAPSPQQATAAPVPAASPAPVQEGPRMDLASAFADFTAQPVAPVSGAVDITSFDPVREVAAPEPPPPPPPPAHPSRHWVQIATGRDVSAFAFDWRRIARTSDGLLEDAEPYVAAWGQTNRLLVGPFDDAGDADALVASLKEAGTDSFRFTSDEGEEVRPLD